MKKSLLCLLTLGTVASASAYERVDASVVKQGGHKVVSTRQLPNGQYETVLALQLDSKRSEAFSSSRFAAPARSGEEMSMEFSYAGGPNSGLRFNGLTAGFTCYQAIVLPEDIVAEYAGNKVTAVRFYTGQSDNVTSADIFIASKVTDLPGNALYTQAVSNIPNADYQEVSVTLDEPFDISADQPFCVGYSAQPDPNGYYIVIDGITDGATNNGMQVGIQTPGSNSVQWNSETSYGSICIYLTITGDNLPTNGLMPYAFSVQKAVAPGVPFTGKLQVANMYANDISSFEYEYKLGTGEAVTATYEFPAGQELPYYYVAEVTLDNLVYDTIGLDNVAELKITKVNGVDNTYPVTTISTQFDCFPTESGYQNHALIEEGTGTWCGYCPIGITMMEVAKELDPDFFNCVALHSGDQMAASSASSVINYYFSGFPQAMINREEVLSPQYILANLETIYEEGSSYTKFMGFNSLEAFTNEAGKAEITANVGVALDTENANRYRLGFYVTEDGVGPYRQTNYYSGQPGSYGWENKGASVNLTFDDVARVLAGTRTGFSKSLPTEMTPGEDYTYTTTASLTAVKGDVYTVIGYIFDNTKGEIVNSYKTTVGTQTGVEAVEGAKAANVYALPGAIAVSGEYEVANVFDLAGRKVASAKGESVINLPAGVYVVNVDGKATKVLVK